MQCVLQFISKILANRLKHVINKLVGTEQNEYLSGRSAYDNVIATHTGSCSFD